MQKKSFLITEVLAMLLGFLGVHRYYTGYVGLGILQTLTFGGFGIWSLIDFIFISLGKYKDANGQELESYDRNLGLGFLIFFIVVTFALVRLPSNKTVINNTYSPNVSDKTESVKRIDSQAFRGCIKLNDVKYCGYHNIASEGSVFDGCVSLVKVAVPEDYEDKEFCGKYVDKKLDDKCEPIKRPDNSAGRTSILSTAIGVTTAALMMNNRRHMQY